jgi:DNA-directed RNA polymerase specialized sigma subunit
MIADLIKNHSLVLKINQMFLSKEEKERRVIDLYYNQAKTVRDIVKELRMSPNAIMGSQVIYYFYITHPSANHL